MSIEAVTSTAGPIGNPVAAIRTASETTGIDFEFLLATAKRESSLNPDAQAKTSTASGLFQFIEQTWLGAVKTHGANHGLSAEANLITRDANGRFTVEDEVTRQRILDLRFDASKAAALAGELAADNKTGLEKRLGRSVNNGALYAAHFLGLGGAAKLLSAAHHDKAADLFPAAAKANKTIFFEGNRAKTVGEVIASFENSFASAKGAQKQSAQRQNGSFDRISSVFYTPTTQTPATSTPAISPPAISTSVSTPAISSDGAARAFSVETPQLPERLSPLALQVLLSLDASVLLEQSSEPDEKQRNLDRTA